MEGFKKVPSFASRPKGPGPLHFSRADSGDTPPDEICLLPSLSELSSEQYLQTFTGIYNNVCSPKRDLNGCKSL